MIRKIFSILFFLLLCDKINANEIKVFYAGFSLSNLYESNENQTKITSSLIKEKDAENNIDIISSKLLKKIRNSRLEKINLETNNSVLISMFFDKKSPL